MSVIRYRSVGERQIRETRNGAEITETVRIQVSDPADSHAVLRRDIPELQRWQRHPTEDGFYVDEFLPVRIPNSLYYTATVRYTNTLEPSPLDQPPKVSMRTEMLRGATITNRRGQLMRNTAGDVIEPQEKNEVIRVYRIRKNVERYPEWIKTLAETVNSSVVRIRHQSEQFPKRSLLLTSVEIGEEVNENDVTYFPLALEIKHRESLWKLIYPSRGFRQLVKSRGLVRVSPNTSTLAQGDIFTLKPITVKGQPPHEPQILNAEGKWIEKPEPSDVVLMEDEIEKETDWSGLRGVLV